jgi:hypothetical protein
MGCCNHEPLGRPISRWRYTAGVAVLTGAQVAGLIALRLVAVPAPRYRKLLEFYLEFIADTRGSVLDRERIQVRARTGPVRDGA